MTAAALDWLTLKVAGIQSAKPFPAPPESDILCVMAGKDIHPVYVLHGDDAFLLDTHRQEIVDRVVAGSDPQVCVTSFDGSAELADVLDELRTVPFLAPLPPSPLPPRGNLVALGRRQMRQSYGFEELPKIELAVGLIREAVNYAEGRAGQLLVK